MNLMSGFFSRIAFSSVGPSISGMTTSETTRSIAPLCSSSTSMASTPFSASTTV